MYGVLVRIMIFDKDGVKLALDSMGTIDTVYIESRIFVPHETIFYELLVKGPVSLFMQHRCNLVDAGDPSGYGEKTETGASRNFSSLTNSVRTYKLKLPDEYYVKDATLYWITRKNVFYKATSSSQIMKVFPEKAKELKQFIKDHKLDLRNIPEVNLFQ